MMIRNREQSLEQLSEALRSEQLRKVITQGYSDISLSVMADFSQEYCRMIADSRYSPDTVNKLTKAYLHNKISDDDLLHVMNYSAHTVKNAPYVDTYLNSIDEGVYHTTASRIFTAVNYESCTYTQGLDLVKSDAYYPTMNASLSVTDKTALELEDLGVPLRGCKGFNFCYDITNAKESLADGDAVFVSDKSLAVTVHEMMVLPDWEKFRDNAKYVMDGDMDKLTGEMLMELYTNYVCENNSIALFNKVKGEYDAFIAGIKQEPADVIVQSAYEIVSKEDITLYCQEYTPELTPKQYGVLLSSENTLDEVYEQWCNNGELHGLEDIGVALEETADRIQISIDRSRAEQMTVSKPAPEPVPKKKQEQAVKPKHKSR